MYLIIVFFNKFIYFCRMKVKKTINNIRNMSQIKFSFKIKPVFFSFLFIFSFISVFPQKNTYIKGVSGDSLINQVAIMYFNPFFDNDFNPVRFHPIEIDGQVFHEQLSLHTFQTGAISTINNRMQKIFITPGDSVFFVTDSLSYGIWKKRVVFKFSGKNAANYNYGYLSETKLYPAFNKSIGILAYKDTLLKFREEKNVFLKNYIQEYSVTNEFYEYAKADILNEYITHLYYPLLTGGGNRIEMKDIPFGYFDDNSHPINELSNDYSSAMLYRYIDYHSENIWNSLEAIYNDFKNGFYGKEREYLISALIGRFAQKQLPDYRTQLMNIIQEASQYVKDSLYLDYINRAKIFYLLVNNPFPEEVKLNTFLKEYGKETVVSLNEVLQKFAGKPLFIDFWASWCGPCIGDIENSQEVKTYLTKKGVEYIYIAYNDKENAWKKTCEKLGITANQYMLLNSNQSPVYDYLKILEIPRYVLLDADHKIISGKAPSPVLAFFDELKDCIDKCFKKSIYY